jgi:hypothetical protein
LPRLLAPPCETLQPEELLLAVEHGVRDAEARNFTLRGPVRLYIDMMILLGAGFASDPQYPWISQLLATREDTAEMDRALSLHAAVSAYLAEVDGESNAYTLQALARLYRLHEQGVSFPDDGLEHELLRLMSQIHPRKVARTGEAALLRLVVEALARARQQYGFRSPRARALLPVLSFAFGHRCDSDPFLPWIARTLARLDPSDPDAAAQALERRAITWLAAVLRNAGTHS